MNRVNTVITAANRFAVETGLGIHRTVRDVADHIDGGDDSADAYELLLDAQRLLCNVHGTRA
jgi:hypothetical protein